MAYRIANIYQRIETAEQRIPNSAYIKQITKNRAYKTDNTENREQRIENI